MIHRRDFLKRSLSGAGLTLMPELQHAAAAGGKFRFGAQTNTWGVPVKPYEHLLEVLDALVNLGYTGFETNYVALEPQFERAADCRKAFASRHIELVAAHTSVRFLPSVDPKTQVESIRRIAGFTAAMGAHHLIASGAFPRDESQIDAAAIAKTLNLVGEACRTEGLRLCYHNHIAEFKGSPPAIDGILRDTDPALVWLNYDIGNAYPSGPKPGDFSSQHYNRIAIYHIKDVKEGPNGKTVPTDLGSGAIDIRAVIAPLMKHNWQGWLVVEREGNYPHAAENPEVLLKQCRNYLRHITGE